jgi:hypothetical protein
VIAGGRGRKFRKVGTKFRGRHTQLLTRTEKTGNLVGSQDRRGWLFLVCHITLRNVAIGDSRDGKGDAALLILQTNAKCGVKGTPLFSSCKRLRSVVEERHAANRPCRSRRSGVPRAEPRGGPPATVREGRGVRRGHARTGRPLGSPTFLDRLERLVGRVLKPHKPGPKPKPRKPRIRENRVG